MTDYEQLIADFEHEVNKAHGEGWDFVDLSIEDGNEILALLKEQEPRVMTLKEIISIGPEDVCRIIEVKEEEHMYGCYMRQYDEEHVEVLCDIPNLPEKLQKGCARIWTSRPTDEQRKAVKWV